jgi:hypothetical protein
VVNNSGPYVQRAHERETVESHALYNRLAVLREMRGNEAAQSGRCYGLRCEA